VQPSAGDQHPSYDLSKNDKTECQGRNVRRDTTLLRILLAVLLFALLVGSGLLYLVSLESANDWPELAHLRLPTFLAVLVGLAPVVIAVKRVFEFLSVVESGEAFSTHTVQILRQLRLLVAVFAGHFAIGLVGFWALSGLMHITLLFAWGVLEVAALFVLTLLALLERLFREALELRQDNELTV
jgi:NAD/NADP transhydrogenase beta subunit